MPKFGKIRLTLRFAIFGLAALAASAQPARAERFANQFIEFETPPNWLCVLEGAEWVCQSKADNQKRDAIIIFAAKLKGDQDSLDQYLAYLKGSKTFKSVQNKAVSSEPKYAKMVEINNHAWVDALHLESEIPGFYTRYLATVKNDIGVLVTYSINKTKYQQYQPQFEAMVRTLKVFRKPGGLNTKENGLFDVKIPAAVNEGTVFPNVQGGAEDRPKRKKNDDIPMPLLLGGLGIIGYFIWRRRQNRG